MTPYKPHQDASGYPGAKLPLERTEKLRKLDVEVDDITVEDIVHSVSRNGSSIFFAMLRMVAEAYGEEDAQTFARRFGYMVGRSNYKKMQSRYGVTSLGAERMSQYEDTVHLLGGVDMAHCFSEYNDNTCVIRRTRCSFHTGAPDGAGHYCRYVNEGFGQAYQELDPKIIEATYGPSMTNGAAECVHVFKFGTEREE